MALPLSVGIWTMPLKLPSKTAHWATRKIHSSHFGLFLVTISCEYSFVRTVSMAPFCFVLLEYIPHVVDCFSSWLHCLWQLLWMIIWNKLFQYVGLFLPFAVWVSVMVFFVSCFCHFFEINFVSWHFCLVSFGNFVASFSLFQYLFWLQNSAWSLGRLF